MKSFVAFGRKLNTLNQKSLELTKEVLAERERLEATLVSIKPQLSKSL
jgi:hypothetical protein